uniref:Uncharacterized protein n=1 Tax=Salmonella enterica subsp. enterica serovar California TaxID=29474 RepID=A0A4P8WGQ2_SALET|nr:Hypothetical protein [Salmonella enterica subsp. enterica serovar California]
MISLSPPTICNSAEIPNLLANLCNVPSSCPSSNPPMFFRTYEIFRFCSGFWPSARLTRSRGSLARRLPLTLDCAIQKAAA